MNRILFFFRRLVRMDFSRFSGVFRELREMTGKNSALLLLDLLWCGVRYNAGYMDYKIARMDRLNAFQRGTVITRGISNDIVKRMNDKSCWYFFDDKCVFNDKFARWVMRDWIRADGNLTAEALAAFCRGKGPLFVKPLTGSSGVGVERLEPESFADSAFFLRHLREKGDCIVEETILQHEEMARLYPGSVNTVRIATLLGEKAEGIVYAFLRIGNGRVMDNIDAGGMAARVDLETGVLNSVAADKKGREFSRHPLTDTQIPGFEVPYFEEAKAMCLEAMRVVPQVRFVAWDVAITQNGPVMIEGNSFPSHAVPQFAAHYPDGIGILPEFERFITL
jgi:hypothetical protein